jgi:hypothetical protein
MLDETPARPARRISPVARALRPLQLRIGVLQEQTAFLVARNLYAMRQPGDRVGEPEVAEKRRQLAEVLVELETIIGALPQHLRHDGRLGDTRAAITRLDQALDILGDEPPR